MFFEQLKNIVIITLLFFLPHDLRVLASVCKPKCGIPSSWLPVAQNVCHGTTEDSFKSFTINRDCHLCALRLTHVSGHQSAHYADPGLWTRWGGRKGHNDRMCTFILDADNKLWFPKSHNHDGYYELDGYGFDDDVIVVKKNETLSAGTVLKAAFGRDYIDVFEGFNGGVHCMDIHMSCIE